MIFSYDFESSDVLTMTSLWFSQQLTMKRITTLLVIKDLPYLPWITFSISCISQTASTVSEPFGLFLSILRHSPHPPTELHSALFSGLPADSLFWRSLRAKSCFIWLVFIICFLPVFFLCKYLNPIKHKIFYCVFLLTPYPKLFFLSIVLY